MQYETPEEGIRKDLLDRLKDLEGSPATGTLSELAYRRAREALERALDEARTIRLQAIEDARATRERELTSLMDAMRAMRDAAEAQARATTQTAAIEADRLRDQARAEAREMIERASTEASDVRAEAAAARSAADERLSAAERLEADFNEILRTIAKRLGLEPEPAEGWFRRLFSRRQKRHRQA